MGSNGKIKGTALWLLRACRAERSTLGLRVACCGILLGGCHWAALSTPEGRPAVSPSVVEAQPAGPRSKVSAASSKQALKSQARPTPSSDSARDETAVPLKAATGALHPLETFSDAQLVELVKSKLASLGSMSLGKPNGGKLINGVQMPKDGCWHLVDAAHGFGTQETVDYLSSAIANVVAQFDESPPLHIGHISGPKGGHLRPHKSHQSGRDVDIGFYYKNGSTWYQRGTEKTLDIPRTWGLVRALITETDVRLILLDHSVQRILRDYATSIGEDETWLTKVFKGSRQRMPIIRHEPGHATHLHVRFHNPIAEQSARRCYPALVASGQLAPPVYYVQHRVRKGESLIRLARRYGTTVRAIQRANGLRSTKIMARKTYRIPRKGMPRQSGAAGLPPRLVAPPRSSGIAAGGGRCAEVPK